MSIKKLTPHLTKLENQIEIFYLIMLNIFIYASIINIKNQEQLLYTISALFALTYLIYVDTANIVFRSKIKYDFLNTYKIIFTKRFLINLAISIIILIIATPLIIMSVDIFIYLIKEYKFLGFAFFMFIFLTISSINKERFKKAGKKIFIFLVIVSLISMLLMKNNF